MGLFHMSPGVRSDTRQFRISSERSVKTILTKEWLPNPDARNFRILASLKIDNYLIVSINYPDCVNFEGNKTLVYRGITISQLKRRKEIDPHFKENDKFSPIARFAPTQEGWEMAMKFVKNA